MTSATKFEMGQTVTPYTTKGQDLPRLPDWVPPAADDINDLSDASRTKQEVASPTTPLPVVYGRDKVAGKIGVVHVDEINGFLYILFVFAEPSTAIDKLFVDNIDVNDATEGLVANGGEIEYYPAGGVVSPLLSTVIGGYNDAPDACHVVIKIPASYSRPFPRVEAIIRGRAVYDPRTTLTEYSTNPSLCFADAAAKAGWEVNWTSVIDAADFNDEVVGGAPRRSLGLTLAEPRSAEEWAKVFRVYTGCFLVWEDGKVRMIPDRAVTLPADVSRTFNADSILADTIVLRRRNPTSFPTTVIVEYRDNYDDNNWRTERAVYEQPAVSSHRVSRVSLPGIHSYAQAYREAKERQQKFFTDLTVEMTVFDEALELQIGSVVRVVHPVGLDNYFRVQSFSNEQGRWRLSLSEYSSTVYSNDAPAAPSGYVSITGSPDAVGGGGSGGGAYIGESIGLGADVYKSTNQVTAPKKHIFRSIEGQNGIEVLQTEDTVIIQPTPKFPVADIIDFVVGTCDTNPCGLWLLPADYLPNTVVGDFVIAVITYQAYNFSWGSGPGVFTGPTGWKALARGAGGLCAEVWYKFMTAEDLTTDVEWTHNGTKIPNACINFYSYRNVNPERPFYSFNSDYYLGYTSDGSFAGGSGAIAVYSERQPALAITEIVFIGNFDAEGWTVNPPYVANEIPYLSRETRNFPSGGGDTPLRCFQIGTWNASIKSDENLIPGESEFYSMEDASWLFEGCNVTRQHYPLAEVLFSRLNMGGFGGAGKHRAYRELNLAVGESATFWVAIRSEGNSYHHMYVEDPSGTPYGVFWYQNSGSFRNYQEFGTLGTGRGTFWQARQFWNWDNDGQPSTDGGYFAIRFTAQEAGVHKFCVGPANGASGTSEYFTGNASSIILRHCGLRRGVWIPSYIPTPNGAVSDGAATYTAATPGWWPTAYRTMRQFTLTLNALDSIVYPAAKFDSHSGDGLEPTQYIEADGTLVANSDGWLQDDMAGFSVITKLVQPTLNGAPGKYYFEATYTDGTSSYVESCGVYPPLTGWPGKYTGSASFPGFYLAKVAEGLGQWANGEVIGVQIDYETAQVRFYSNNTLIKTISIAAYTDVPLGAFVQSGINYGEGLCTWRVRLKPPFVYGTPAGFVEYDVFGSSDFDPEDQTGTLGAGASIVRDTDPVTYRSLIGGNAITVTEGDTEVTIDWAPEELASMPDATIDHAVDKILVEDATDGTVKKVDSEQVAFAYQKLAVRDEILLDAPTAYWPMDDGVVPIEDAGTGNYDATATSLVGGDFTQALIAATPAVLFPNFDTNTDYVAFPLTPFGGRPINGDWTWEAVVRVDNVSAISARLFGLGANGETLATNFQILITAQQTTGLLEILWEYGNGTNETMVSSSIVLLNKTYHLTIIKDSAADKLFIYINGVLKETLSYVNEPTGGTSATWARIGYDGVTNTGLFSMGHMAFYSGVKLKSERIFAHAAKLGFAGTGSSETPTTTVGDMIVRGTLGDERLPIGTVGQMLRVGGALKPEWAAATSVGGSGSSVGAKHPDNPPLAPTIWDDEFDTAALDSKWVKTAYNAGTATETMSQGCLVVTTDSNDPVHYRQPITGSTWKFRSKLALHSADATTRFENYQQAGIAVYHAASTKWLSFHLIHTTTVQMEISRWTAGTFNTATTYNVFGTDTEDAMRMWVYLEIECDGTNLIFRYSRDGVMFVQVHSETITNHLGAGNVPDYVALQMTTASGDTIHAVYDWFRKIEAGYDVTKVGRVIGLGNSVDPKWRYELFDDLENNLDDASNTTGINWTFYATGTGSIVNVSNSLEDGNHIGVLDCVTGTTSTGQALLSRHRQVPQTAYAAGIKLDATDLVFEGLFHIGNVPDAAQNSTGRIGMADMATGFNHAAIVAWQYNGSAAVFSLITENSNVGTTTQSAVAITTGWHHCKILMSSSRVEAYVDGALVATNTTNVPTGNIHPVFGIVKSAGTTSHSAALDLIWVYKDFDVARNTYLSEAGDTSGLGGSGPLSPDTPPTAPNAMDDEFEGVSLDSKWAWRNQNGSTAVLEKGLLVLTDGNTAGDNVCVLEQTVSGSFTVRAKLSAIYVNHGNDGRGGLACFVNSSGKGYLFGKYYASGTWNFFVNKQTTAAVYSSTLGTVAGVAGPNLYTGNGTPTYLQIRYDGTTVYFEISQDGVNFRTFLSEASATFLGAAPDRVGLFHDYYTNASKAVFDWFRKIA